MTDHGSSYIVDTHALLWYWNDPQRLGNNADSAFRAIEQGRAVGLIPAICVLELFYLTSRRRETLSTATILSRIERSPALRLDPVNRPHLLAFDRLSDIAEIHDRLIAASGLVHDATVITDDANIRASHLVRTVW